MPKVDTFNYAYAHAYADAVEWQPIETAPKDGTDIVAALLYRDGCDGGILTIRWHESWGQWVMSGCTIGIQNNVKDDENMDPTHWIHLPTPPKP